MGRIIQFGELLWVVTIIFTGIGVRLFDGAGTDPEIGTQNLLIGAGVLSLVAAVFFIVEFIRNVPDNFWKKLLTCFGKIVTEAVWAIALVWSSSSITSEFVDADAEQWASVTWRSFITTGAALNLIAFALIAVRVAIAVKHGKPCYSCKKP